jgi:hypothetical protein
MQSAIELGRSLTQAMSLWHYVQFQGGIRQIRYRLCCCTEGWRRIFPTHWEHQWESYQGFYSWWGRENNSKLRDIIRIYINPVETISNIHFQNIHCAVVRIG